MKTKDVFRIAFSLALSVLLTFQLNAQKTGKKIFLIMHPTVGNIQTISTLVNEGIFPVKNVEFHGVYFSEENYNYSESRKFIAKNKLDFKLEEIKGILKPSTLFGINPCTESFKKLFNESSGVLFNGGPDLPPVIYGDKTSTLTVIEDPYRHYFEASFLFHLLGGSQDTTFIPLMDKNPDYLIVAICLGLQTMNVATGGTLVQDIPSEVYHLYKVEDILNQPDENLHRNYETNIADSLDFFRGSIHPIRINKDSWMISDKLVSAGQNPGVLSSHHQAVKKLGKNLEVDARSMDGNIVEAMHHRLYPNVFAFQFHPEVPDIYNYDNSYLFKASEPPESLRTRIEKENGYEFNLALWHWFAGILNDAK
ncbi:MAG: gamma-glutamyl-gamma-aminobutyrate hydrolase family protein [Bacteroidales bacterium]|nr:gamma-glutamyl-gamma-aminobutyrate hydrolase family protein [Bacteroidales bacterium]MCB9012935.1 gamma-glutamyl-gamma-aminobutyrate hydrolase family protein [Bacteroidales bacterium]